MYRFHVDLLHGGVQGGISCLRRSIWGLQGSHAPHVASKEKKKHPLELYI
jgi:hypothetical protein